MKNFHEGDYFPFQSGYGVLIYLEPKSPSPQNYSNIALHCIPTLYLKFLKIILI